jgi:subtilisin family serine protease
VNTAIKTMKFLVIASVVALFSTAQAQTAKRYIIIYKSETGFKQMDNYMKLESSNKAFGLSKSLKNIQMQVIKSSNAAAIEKLKTHPEIEAVVEEIVWPAPKLASHFKVSATPADIIHPLNANANPDAFMQTDGTPWGITAVHAPGAWGLSDAGSKSRVLVIDTGVDVNHEALSQQIEATKNFTAGATGTVDPKNIVDEVGHGTHCSGTVLGQYNDQTGFVGVAPKAKLLMGKVCTAQGCQLGDIAAAVDWGIEQKVDVMSMSLGGPGATGNFVQDLLIEYMNQPLKAALAKAETAGIFIAAASGNSATEEVPATPTTPAVPAANPKMGYPAKAPTVFAVGALDSTLKKTSFSQWGPELDITAPGAGVLSSVPMQSGRDSLVYLMVGGQKNKVKSVSFAGTKEITIPKMGSLVYAGLGKPEDFAKINVAGQFALIQRGEIAFADKVKNAQAANATGVIIFNNTAGLAQGTLSADGKTEIDFPVVMIEQVEGDKLVALLNAGQVASSEVSTIKTNYSLFDGTSMATPHVAGVAALVISAYKLNHGGKTLTPAEVRSFLSKTAVPLGPNKDNQYGAGLVQADKAVAAASK